MSDVIRITPETAQKLLAEHDVLLLDMRERADFDSQHHPAALHLEHRNVKTLLMSTSREQTVVICCYQGNSSVEMARLFTDFGFRRVYSVDGGFRAWQPLLNSSACAPSDLDRPGQWGMTALMRAAQAGDGLEVQKLLAAGASVGRRNDDGNNALWFACRANSADCMRLLINAGIDIDNQNANGATALIYAAAAGLTEMVQMLLASGADTSRRTLDDFTALDVAASRDIMKLLMACERMAVGQ